MYHIYLFFCQIYTFLFRHYFQSFGKKSIIKPFLNFSHPEYIKIGDHVNVGNSCRITVSTDFCGIQTQSITKTKINIGNHVDIGDHTFISANNDIKIGNHVIMAPFVFITDHDHGFHDINKNLHQQPLTQNGHISIGDNVFLGTKCSILKNVSIGQHSVVGANSVVTQDVPDFCIVAGNPAKIIKKIK